MRTVQSKDGTTIAYDRTGEGPPLIYVGGALNDRGSGAALAAPAVIGQMRGAPMWPALEALAPSLAHDSAVMADGGRGAAMPAERLAAVRVPTLVLAGGASPPWMREVARRIADALPDGRYRTLDGQTHDVAAEALAPELEEHFKG